MLNRLHPPAPSPVIASKAKQGKRAVLYIFNKLINFHIIFNALIITFQPLRNKSATFK